MGDQKQTDGRDANAAIPVDQWASKGLGDRDVAKAAAEGSRDLSEQAYGANEDAKQRDEAERTGRTEVIAEPKTFKSGEAPTPDADDLEGPAGDPAEGKRDDGDNPAV